MSASAQLERWRDRSCLVTGAGGFIGSALVHTLQRHGARVWSLARRAAPGASARDSRLLLGDATDLPTVQAALRRARPEVVFHLASRVSGSRELGLVVPTLRDNLLGFVNVALAASEHHAARVVTMGSLQEPDETPLSVACSPYAAAKFSASVYGRMFHGVFGLPITIARTFMVYGPGQLDFTKVLPYTVSRLLHGQTAEFSSARQAFDWVHVDDVCEALLAMADADCLGRSVDVGTGTLTPVATVVRLAAERLGLTQRLLFDRLPDRRGEPTRAADVETTATLTGWRARRDLAEGIAETVDWYAARHAAVHEHERACVP